MAELWYEAQFLFFPISACVDITDISLHVYDILHLIPESTARSVVPGVSPGRGLIVLLRLRVSEVQSRCSWQYGSMGGHNIIVTLISKLWRTIVSNSFDLLTRLFCSFPNHDTTLRVILKFAFCSNSFQSRKCHQKHGNL